MIEWSSMFFDSWRAIGRVLVVGVCGYVLLVFVLRMSGKRTLSKMNAFDFIVTVAIGSGFAAMLLTKDIPLAEGMIGLSLLVLLQYVVTWLSVRSKRFSDLVKSQPTLLFFRGKFLHDAMRRQRINEAEVFGAIRESGIAGVEDVEAVVLEPTGTLAVLRRTDAPPTALEGVARRQDHVSLE
jgi:uncharacterized membrane protein YcaP (DUF421 family)